MRNLVSPNGLKLSSFRVLFFHLIRYY